MSPTRQPAPRIRRTPRPRRPDSGGTPGSRGPLVRTIAFDVSRQSFHGLGAGWHQLLFPVRGTLHVTVGERLWVVPPGQGLWIGGGVRHQVRVTVPTGIRAVFFRTTIARLPSRMPRRIRISPLLRELLRRTIDLGTLDAANSSHRHLLAVIIDELVAIRQPPLDLRMPKDPRAARPAALIRANPATGFTIGAAAGAGATSARTLQRLFRAETGLSFAAWRRQARLTHAVQLIGDGTPIGRAAAQVGYRGPSAFVAAFRRAFGVTPARYLAAP